MILLCYSDNNFRLYMGDEKKLLKKYPLLYNNNDILRIEGNTQNELEKNYLKYYNIEMSEGLKDYLQDVISNPIDGDNYISDNIDSINKLFKLNIGDKLFHGSKKLFIIQCFIYNNKQIIEEYMKIQKYLMFFEYEESKNLPQLIQKVYKLFDNYFYKNPNRLIWNYHTLFIALLKILKKMNLFEVKISNLLASIYELKDHLLIINMIDFCKKVEHGVEVFEPEFFSSMNQPVQFFSFHNKTNYGGDYKYVYNLHEQIKLLDITDNNTILNLSNTVFKDKHAYKEKEIFFYGSLEKNLVEARLNIIKTFIKSFKLNTNKPLIPVTTIADIIIYYYKPKNLELRFNINFEEWAVSWNKYFEIELFSPYGLWIFSHMFKLQNIKIFEKPMNRYSIEEVDSMILITLRKSNYQGWYSIVGIEGKEILVIHPEFYGNMIPINQYDMSIENCDLNV